MSRSLLVRFAGPERWQWLVERTRCALTSDFSAIEAVDPAGNVRGMVGYCNTTPASVQAHMAVEHPIVWRSLVCPAFAYPFVNAGKAIVMGVVPADNRQSLQMCAHLGFREAHRVSGGWAPGVDLVLFEMRRNECRWLERDMWRS